MFLVFLCRRKVKQVVAPTKLWGPGDSQVSWALSLVIGKTLFNTNFLLTGMLMVKCWWLMSPVFNYRLSLSGEGCDL